MSNELGNLVQETWTNEFRVRYWNTGTHQTEDKIFDNRVDAEEFVFQMED